MAEIVGTAGHDILDGTTAADEILGLAGDDVITGGDGGDELIGGEGNDQLYGDAGADLLDGDEINMGAPLRQGPRFVSHPKKSANFYALSARGPLAGWGPNIVTIFTGTAGADTLAWASP